ncbi:MAG: von Willebrand factor type A domain-containing protein [Bacteriovoracaceae bacterium]|nr:von Willebrand factor type A domain-containing protein [Bacteriovoracaceae bacterium]
MSKLAKNLLDDPRLTAYALGELPATEAKEFEMELQKDKEAQEEVKTIQKQAGLLKEELKSESEPRLTYEQREKVMPTSKTSWFMKWGLGGAIAAMLVVIVFKEPLMRKMISDDEGLAGKVFGKAEGIQEETVAEMEQDIAASPAIARAEKKEVQRSRVAKKSMAKMKSSRAMAPQAAMESVASFGLKGGGAVGSIAPWPGHPPAEPANSESYAEAKVNEFIRVLDNPLSTFSVDVDTASYSNMRRFINNGTLPPKDSVKVEEFINYFNYKYPAPTGKTPFTVNMEVAKSPWNKDYKLVRIGLKGKEIALNSRPNSNLVFLLDVSGSMSNPNKLPLLKESLKMLLRKLDERDRISIVVYAGASGLVLKPTPANKKVDIIQALNRLNAGGSTNGGAGIELAYKTAMEGYIKGGINRVILATDGDFNVGTTGRSALLELIKKKAESKIFLTVLGLGMGNYKDDTLETLAQNGNGNYAYIDNMNEAKKVLNEDLSGTLMTIAKDVKFQVEFNPAKVSGYRLVGYENRMLKARDFNDDKKDAGEVGAGHTVTAFYEIIPAGVKFKGPGIDKLKYQVAKAAPKKVLKEEVSGSSELLTVKLRYKEPEGKESTKVEFPLNGANTEFNNASEDFRFAAAVATYAQILKEDSRVGDKKLSDVLSIAKNAKGTDKYSYRQEFIELVELANEIKNPVSK